jgi:hypothetical protein
MVVGQLHRRRVTADLPDLVADAVNHRLAKVALHRAHMPRLEQIETLQEIEGGVLHEVVRVQMSAGGRRELTVGPASERRQAALEERLRGQAVAGPGPYDKLQRRLVAQKRALLGFGRCGSDGFCGGFFVCH